MLQEWRISGNFGGAGADLRPFGGSPDENCFTMSRTGGMGVKSAPCWKLKRRFRVKGIIPKIDISFQCYSSNPLVTLGDFCLQIERISESWGMRKWEANSFGVS